MKNMQSVVFVILFVIFSIVPVKAAMKKVNFEETGIEEFFPACTEKRDAICVKTIQVGEENQVFISIFIDIDAIPQFDGDDTSAKMNGVSGGMSLSLALFNSRHPKPPGAANDYVKLNLDGGNSENIVILAEAILNKEKYSGFAFLRSDNRRVMAVIETKLSPIDLYKEGKAKYK
ncbi:hypothetical protein MHN79_10935 [Vibrio sp. Of14-4]|uniref:hypothetical protein n=1 Tax=Vibrio sp. Of14-4 TaxID=2724878 RepID=UPI001EF1EFD3|nr:hypothetical protein [Vibrio sp. Of14-4]MCG7490005.1 hypothetical protein [Vibrio sp. Of14-4]